MGGVSGGPSIIIRMTYQPGMFVNIYILRLSVFIPSSWSANRFLKFAFLCRLLQHQVTD